MLFRSPADVPTTDATNRLIAARAAFAAGGVPGLEAWLSNSPPSGDPELHLLRSFMQPGFTPPAPGPGGAYLASSDATRVGNECVGTCTSRWEPHHSNKTQNKTST